MTQELEKTLWATADKFPNNMDAAEYKHVVLGLIFLKYIPDRFDELHKSLEKDTYADPEYKDEFLAENIIAFPNSSRILILEGQKNLIRLTM